MPTVQKDDPDLIWIEDAVKEWGRSRRFLDDLVSKGKLQFAKFTGDPKLYLLRSDLAKVLGQTQVQRKDDESESDAS